MSKKPRHSRAKKTGAPPGTLIHVGTVKAPQSVITVFEYDANQVSEYSLPTGLEKLLQKPSIRLWLNIYGLQDPKLMGEIGAKFGLHPLVMEDILHTDQRPKVENYEHYLYIVARSFDYNKISMEMSSEQISIVLGHDFVLTFQEQPTGTFDPLRERLRTGKCTLRDTGSDYLAYSLLDMIVDRYFTVLEQVGDDCEALEDLLLNQPSTDLLHRIHHLKRATMEMRRAVWPLRELLNNLIRNEYQMFASTTQPYLRDVYDHTVHFVESLEAIRDLLGGMLDIYLSSISNRVNMEVRALTVVAMLFMPATLIAGIFGMNFHSMPLLADADGFWVSLMMMGVIAISMGLVFWRRQWLNRRA